MAKIRFPGSNMAMIAGRINASAGTDAVLTDNDGAATLTRGGTGDYTVTFVDNFNAAPVVTCAVVDATFSTLAEYSMVIQAVATSSVQFNVVLNATNATVTALADMDFHFMVVGSRER